MALGRSSNQQRQTLKGYDWFDDAIRPLSAELAEEVAHLFGFGPKVSKDAGFLRRLKLLIEFFSK